MDDMRLARLVRQSILARTWADAKRFLKEHPELLTDRADEVMAMLMSAAEEAGNEPVAWAFRQHRQLLRRSREFGIETAFQEAEEARLQEQLAHLAKRLTEPVDPERFGGDEDEPDPGGALTEALHAIVGRDPVTPAAPDVDSAEPGGPLGEAERVLRGQLLTDAARQLEGPEGGGPVAAAVEELVEARTWVAAQRARFQHPELLSDRADELLGRAAAAARARGEESVVRCLEGHRRLLAAYRRTGPIGAPAGSAEGAGSGGARLPEEVGRLLDEVGDADPATDPRRHLGLLEQAIALVSHAGNQHLWAALQAQLGLLLLDPFGSGAAGGPDDLRRAIACFDAAREVFTRESLPGEWAAMRLCLGMAYGRRFEEDRAANLETAIEHVQAALEVFAAEVLPAEWAKGQVVLGSIYADRILKERADNLERAIGCLRAALAVLTAEEEPAEWITAQNSLGNAYLARVLGDPDANVERAVACLEAALAAANRAPFPALRAQANRSLGIAATVRATSGGTFRAAAPELERAVACLNSALESSTPDRSPYQWASTQAVLGNAHAALAEVDPDADAGQAVACYDAALKVLTRDSFPTDWAQIQHNLGGLYATLAKRDPRERAANLAHAVGCCQGALAVFEVSGTPAQRRLTGRMLGDAAAEAGRWDEAAQGYGAALDAHEALYGASLLRGAKEAELAEATGLHQRAAYALARCGRRGEAAVSLERGRARGVAEVVARDRLDLEEAERQDPAAARAYREAAERLRAVEAAQWRGADATPIFPGGLEEIEDLERASRKVEQALRPEAEAAQAALADAVERIRAAGVEGFLARPGLGDVAAAVTPAQPLAYVMVTPFGGATLLVHRTGRVPSSGDAGIETGEELAIERVEAVGDGRTLAPELVALLVTQDRGRIIGGYLPGQSPMAPRSWLPAALAGLLPLLGERLIGPLAARLAELGAEGVALVACGGLGLLSLHAAPYRRDGLDRCLLDDFDVSYTPSARALRAAWSALPTRERTPTLAGVGNPLPVPKPLAPIEFAEAELDGVAACFDNDVELFYGVAATKAALLSAAGRATHVHLSCHGLLRPDRPMSAAFLLAEGDRLTLTEVLAERPFGNARLVVASACQTGVTDFTHPLDEEVGLPAGFLQAGAAGVVATLWPVHGVSTAMLMVRFYQYHLQGDPTQGEGPMPPAKALCRAQRWLARATVAELDDFVGRHPALYQVAVREAARLEEAASAHAPTARSAVNVGDSGPDDPADRPFAAPYFWAPFVFVGA